MDDPVKDIAGVITTLCTASPSVQRRAVETHFTPTASFTHPFCRSGSFNGSRWFIAQVYRWYKILSPRIDVKVDSVCEYPNFVVLTGTLMNLFSVRRTQHDPLRRDSSNLQDLGCALLQSSTESRHCPSAYPGCRPTGPGHKKHRV